MFTEYMVRNSFESGNLEDQAGMTR